MASVLCSMWLACVQRPLPDQLSAGPLRGPGPVSGLWRRDAEVLADLAGHVVGDLGVAGDGGAPDGRPVDIHRVPCAFAQELAAMILEMLQECSPLHTLRGSRTTSRPSNSVLVNSLLASRTS